MNKRLISALAGPNAIRKEKKAKQVKVKIANQKKFINLRDKNFKKKDLQFNFLSNDNVFENKMSSNFQDCYTMYSSFSTSAASSVYKRYMEETTMEFETSDTERKLRKSSRKA